MNRVAARALTLLPLLLSSAGCATPPPPAPLMTRVCLPLRVLSSAKDAQAPAGHAPNGWAVSAVSTKPRDQPWISQRWAFEPRVPVGPSSTTKVGPIIHPETTREPAFCEELQAGTYMITMLATSPPTAYDGKRHPFQFSGELSVSPPSGENPTRLLLYLGDRTLAPFCGWKGTASLMRSNSPLVSLNVVPDLSPGAEAEPCVSVEPVLE